MSDNGEEGGSHIEMVNVYVPAFWGAFHRFLYSDRVGGIVIEEGGQFT